MRARLIAGSAAGALVLMGWAVPAQAAETAKLSVLHGVPGLTVDVWVNGERTLDDFTPGTLAGPLELAAGTYTVAITAADATGPSPAAIGPVRVESRPTAPGVHEHPLRHILGVGRPAERAESHRVHEGSPATVGLGQRLLVAESEGAADGLGLHAVRPPGVPGGNAAAGSVLVGSPHAGAPWSLAWWSARASGGR